MAAPMNSVHCFKMKFQRQLLSVLLKRPHLSINKPLHRCYHMQRNVSIRGNNHQLFKRSQPVLVCAVPVHRLDSTDASKSVPGDTPLTDSAQVLGDTPITDSVQVPGDTPITDSVQVPGDTPLTDSVNYIPEPPPLPTDILDKLDLNAIGEPTLASLGLGKMNPPGLVQQALEYLHVGLDIPWWGTIVIGTLFVRLFIFPIAVIGQRASINMSNHMPTLEKLQERITAARIHGDTLESIRLTHEYMDYMKRNNLKMFRGFLMPIAQFPIFISWFWGLRGMARLPVESMKTGGLYWFTDLTIPDPFYGLPLLTVTSLAIMIQLGSDGMPIKSMGSGMQMFMRAIPIVVFFFTSYFPAAMCVYWATSNAFSLLQFGFLKIPRVRKYFKIPERIKHPVDKKEKKGVIQGFKETMDNQRLTRIVEERQRIDAINFQKAGQGAVPKTYAYNPKERKRQEKKQQGAAIKAKSSN